MTDYDPDDCPMCYGTGEIQSVNFGDVPCPNCSAKEGEQLRARIAELEEQKTRHVIEDTWPYWYFIHTEGDGKASWEAWYDTNRISYGDADSPVLAIFDAIDFIKSCMVQP